MRLHFGEGEFMYRHEFVPLDGSIESQKVINSIHDVLNLQSEMILFKVTPPMSGQRLGEV